MQKNKLHKLNIYLILIFFTSTFLVSCSDKTSSNNDDVPKKDFALYSKDDALYYSALNKTNPVQISTRKNESENSEYNYYDNETIFGMNTKISKNQNRLFTMQESMDPFQTGTLKFYDIEDNNELANETVISDEVWNYQVSDDGNIIAYNYGKDNHSLNLYDITTKKSSVISENIYKYNLSPDGKRLVFCPKKEEFFELEIGKEKQKIELEDNKTSWYDEIVTPYFYNDTFDSYYYLNKSTLFKKEFGKNPEVISKNVYNILKVFDDGKLYYTTLESQNVPTAIKEMLIDDSIESDKNMANLGSIINSRPDINDYPTLEEFQKANDAYLKAVEKKEEFETINIREEYRKKVKNNEELTAKKYDYYFYDGHQSTQVGSWVTEYTEFSLYDDINPVYHENKPILIFHSGNAKPVKMSKLKRYKDLSSLMESYLIYSAKLYIAIGSDVQEIDTSDIPNIETVQSSISADGKTVFITPVIESINNNRDEVKYDFYKIDISKGKATTPELYDTNISTSYFILNNNQDLFYLKPNTKYKEYNDLYKNKELISQNVIISYFIDEKAEFLALKSKELVERNNTLDYYRDDKVIEIATNVGYYNIITPKRNIIYSKMIDNDVFRNNFYYHNVDTGEDILIVKEAKLVDTGIKWEDVLLY